MNLKKDKRFIIKTFKLNLKANLLSYKVLLTHMFTHWLSNLISYFNRFHIICI